uniref:Uncharacterized protein n=1 Tax=viral metagenome TaxID=1070528 RepID=A0A6C0BPI0_9ZZZZ
MPSSTAKKSSDSSILLSKKIDALTKAQENFGKAVEGCQSLITETLTDIELQINSKKRERDAIETEFEQKKKDLKISMDQELKAHGYEQARKILLERKEEPVTTVELQDLRSQLTTLKTEHQQALQKLTSELNKQHQMKLHQTQQTQELKHKAAVAELKAQLDQKAGEIRVLERTISDLKADLAEQRALTKSVAEAASARPMSFTVPGRS